MNNSNTHDPSEKELKRFEILVSYLNDRNFDSVITEGKKFILEFPDTVFLYVCVSVAYIESERIEEAIAFLKDAEKKFPDNYDILFQLAKAYEKNLELKKAIKYYYKSFDATPEENKKMRADCYNDIGAVLFQSGKEEEAIKVWEEGLVIDPANTLLKNNLLISEIDEDDDFEDFDEIGEDDDYDENDENDDYDNDFADELFFEFSNYQKIQYFNKNEKAKFDSKKEEKKFSAYVDVSFLKNIVPKFLELEKMNEDQRLEFYQGIEIDFNAPIDENEFPKFPDEIADHFQNTFPFLPENGVMMLMLVLPALEYSGISEEKLNNFITQFETPDGRETQILKWAYELGDKVMEFIKMDDSEEKEIAYIEIMKLLSQELNEGDSTIVLDYIFERMSDEDDSL